MRTLIQQKTQSLRRSWLAKSFKLFATHKVYPCLAARASLAHSSTKTLVAANLSSPEDDERILSELYEFIKTWKADPTKLSSFIVIFEGPNNQSEDDFEQMLWGRLQCLHLRDAQNYPWTEKASSDVNSKKFSLSLGGEGFFVIAMHPHSSRKARRFQRPALVFNLHAQFEKLRASGTFETMRDQVRKRDELFSGSVNPMVDDFGAASEALQYSGRLVPKTHKCPFAALARRFSLAD